MSNNKSKRAKNNNSVPLFQTKIFDDRFVEGKSFQTALQNNEPWAIAKFRANLRELTKQKMPTQLALLTAPPLKKK